MPETRFTDVPALSVDPRVGISLSASECDVSLFFIPVIYRNYYNIGFRYHLIYQPETPISDRGLIDRVMTRNPCYNLFII